VFVVDCEPTLGRFEETDVAGVMLPVGHLPPLLERQAVLLERGELGLEERHNFPD
jgi:hypothetical protein